MGRRPKSISAAFEKAEAQGRCVIASDKCELRLMQRHMVADDLVEPLPGLFARRNQWDSLTPNQRSLHAIRGLAIAHPAWVFCGPSAALVHGLRVPYELSSKIYIANGRKDAQCAATEKAGPSVYARNLSLQKGCVPHRRFKHERTESVEGIRVTGSIDTTLDCMLWFELEHSLVIADSFLRWVGCRGDLLEELLEDRRAGCSGIQRARACARYADPRAESGGESYARARMIRLGYALPELQVSFASPLDGSNMRADFLWKTDDGRTIAGELDGFIKLEDSHMTGGASPSRLLARQNLRDTRLALCVDRVFHFTIEEARSDSRFTAILDSYGVPHAATNRTQD